MAAVTRFTTCIAIVAAALLAPAAAQAHTIHVPGDHATIQQGLNVAASGDTVLVAAGTYSGPGNNNLSFHGANIRLIGAGPTLTVIECGGVTRGIVLAGAQDTTALISGLRIQNGFAAGADGGGLQFVGASPSVVDVVIADCSAESGGGASISDGSVARFVGATFVGNTATPRNGGGLYCENSDIHLVDVTFDTNHSASNGGGVLMNGSAPRFDGCRFVGNTSDGGRAAGGFSSGSPTFTDCIVEANSSGRNGGGFSFQSCTGVLIENCVFRRNLATSDGVGGAIALEESAVTIDGSVFVDNEAQESGGAVYVDFESELTVTGSTFVGNDDQQYGGEAIGLNGLSSASVSRTIFAYQREWGSVVRSIGGSTTEFLRSVVWRNAGGDVLPGYLEDVVVTDPQFCDVQARDLTLQTISFCLPENNPWGELIGAVGEGCADQPPGPPTTLRASASEWGGAILVDWAASPEGDIDHYRLERDTTDAFGPWTFSVEGAASPYDDTGLVNGQMYYYRLFAVDQAANESGPSDTVSCAPMGVSPPTPVGLSVESMDSEARLSWAPVSVADLMHYAVYRDTVESAPPGAVHATTSDTFLLDEGLDNYKSYYYRVAAVDTGTLESVPSPDVRAVPHGIPAPPGWLSAMPADASVLLSWADPGCAGLSHFLVIRDTTEQMEAVLLRDDFETYSPGVTPPDPPWIVAEQDGTSSVVSDAHALEGLQSLALVDSSSNFLRVFHVAADSVQSLAEIHCAVRHGASQPAGDLAQVQVFGDHGISSPLAVLDFSDGWLRHWVSGGSPQPVAQYQAGEWHTLDWRLDCRLDSYDLRLDGDLVLEDAPFFNDSEYLDILQFRTRTPDARLWVDDLDWRGRLHPIAYPTGLALTDAPLENGATYYYSIAVVDTFGSVSAWSETVAVVPDPASGAPDPDVEPVAAMLSLAGPNPFRTDARLAFSVPAPGADVHLGVYDVRGRRVSTLTDGWVSPGAHQAVWDGCDRDGNRVASGVYFCRCRIGGWRSDMKLVLIR